MIKYFLLSLSLLISTQGFSKSKKKQKETTTTTEVTEKKEKDKSAFKTIKEFTEKLSKPNEGLFPLYRDTITGKTYIEVNENQLHKEFIYFMYVLDGVVDAGYFRGAYRDNDVITFDRAFDKIEVKIVNTTYYFDPKLEISKAADANINQPIVVAEKIQAMAIDTTDTLGNVNVRYLIDADAIFLKESLSQIKPAKKPGSSPTAFSLGSLSATKTKYLRQQNYPDNTDVEVEYVYDNPAPVSSGKEAVTDPRSVSVKVRHSIIKMPENNYQPRYEDPRIGYFTSKATDMTTTSVTPYLDKINRWNLVKKDSNAILSEPVLPIVYWIENTTPAAFRPIIKEAVEKWNIAFEEAGFKNAVVCKIQPDTATWDAGDIRYNVIRWTSSPNPPFGGYGPSFKNPRTGEIIGADIMLEWIYLTNRVRYEKMFNIAGMAIEQNETELEDNPFLCSAGFHTSENLSYGKTMMDAYNFDSLQHDEFMKQCLTELVLHEVGHTLGLNHNFGGSYFASNDQWQDKEFGEKYGVSASVMDYNLPNISPDKNHQGQYFTTVPGLYDRWAIRYGYSVFENAVAEKQGLKEILSESTKREYLFFNDADDMRSPGKGNDPRAMIYDMTSDPLEYAIQQIKMNNATFSQLKSTYIKDGQSYHELRNAYLILSGRNTTNFNVISRWIGGVLIDRNFAGQKEGQQPFTAIELSEQVKAMNALAQYAFAPDAFDVEKELYNYLQMQRRGYEFYEKGELPKIHARIATTQSNLLKQLLHPNTLERIADTKLYGNPYSLDKMMSDLTKAVFKADIAGTVNSLRQELQINYVNSLLKVINSADYIDLSKSIAYAELQKIKKLATNTAGDAASKAHKQYLLYLIDKGLDKK
ncbi:MAG: zinc-dependent metalloprotease [Chitinophagales bacterium]|nr:zinc-dependent metalloprotease [Chitinophagales bacterium]